MCGYFWEMIPLYVCCMDFVMTSGLVDFVGSKSDIDRKVWGRREEEKISLGPKVGYGV